MNITGLRQEAESGSVVAQSVLGICYLYGREVHVDYEKAFQLLSAASEKGASRAVVNLARMYAEGLGIAKDMPKAIRFYEAVAKVETRAPLELDARGEDVPADPEAALRWYSEVAARKAGMGDSVTAAFVGAVTFEEIEEAKAYVAGRPQ